MRTTCALGLAVLLLVSSSAVVGCGSPSDDEGSGGSVHTTTSQTTGTTSSTTTGNPPGEPAELEGITAAHNDARASVDPPASPPIPPLEWDPTLAAYAQSWADGCVWQHSSGPYGENLYANSATVAGADVVAGWVAEEADYDYASNSCANVCGHYTQVVWRNSARLGCGMAYCASGAPWGGGAWSMWVCSYDPPGNYNGQKPY